MRNRRWFQLHLSTLLALSFTAAGVLWLNMRCSPGYPYIDNYKLRGETYEPIIQHWPSVGWPRAFIHHGWQRVFIQGTAPQSSLPIDLPGSLSNGPRVKTWTLLFDIGVALTILLLVGGCSEWLLRSRANGTKGHE